MRKAAYESIYKHTRLDRGGGRCVSRGLRFRQRESPDSPLPLRPAATGAGGRGAQGILFRAWGRSADCSRAAGLLLEDILRWGRRLVAGLCLLDRAVRGVGAAVPGAVPRE